MFTFSFALSPERSDVDGVHSQIAARAFAYEISQIRLVDPKEVEVMAPTSDAEITLITCAGIFSRGAGYDHRLVVRALRVA